MTIRCVALALALALAGCAIGLRSEGQGSGASAQLLSRADQQVAASQYRSAAALYDEFLQNHPGDPEAPRVRLTRTLIERLLGSQADVERLSRELERLRADDERLSHELERLRADDARLSRELERLRADDARLSREVERLRADLERLRNIDLRPPPGAPPTPR